jgi:hypothetical protein
VQPGWLHGLRPVGWAGAVRPVFTDDAGMPFAAIGTLAPTLTGAAAGLPQTSQ